MSSRGLMAGFDDALAYYGEPDWDLIFDAEPHVRSTHDDITWLYAEGFLP